MKRCYFLVWLTLLSGCAALGTKATFGDAPTAAGIHCVALVTTKIASPMMGLDARQTDSVFVKQFAAKLATATGWQVQYMGDVEAYLKNEVPPLTAQQCQAVVHAELLLKDYGMMRKAHRYNAWARMQVFTVPGKQYVGESRFNTLTGKSYAIHPELGVAIEDAVNGVVKPWAERDQQVKSVR